ncbi:hypothetical protein ONS95_009510 [Cadophora gregata]|uniref:uncharacterized protein n=1 Tax=Cadophora gregata TaxID=51156 RepID=UPI0026DC0866|nr:uncharacterized protein ONS95_009510 [Cadophora gregata]KAK0124562.1 hypothetical protein ONS95_009510 [Cadophora gregata]KAK0129585.1 hypothetical protein ONS96_000151 [Cadophora gregata f. sp. sojae]
MDSTPSPVSRPMEPPEIPPQTRRYRKEEWEVHRGLIVGLYPMQGMKLRTIKQILEHDHGFILKKKIDDWKIGKNVQSSEMAFIVQKQHKRILARKPTIFRARGQPVDPDKILRWQKGPGKQLQNIGSRGYSAKTTYPVRPSDPVQAVPSTPSDISYSPPSAKSPSPKMMEPERDSSPKSQSITDWSENPSQQQPSLVGNFHGNASNLDPNEPSLDSFISQDSTPYEGRSPSPFTLRPSPAPSPRLSYVSQGNFSSFATHGSSYGSSFDLLGSPSLGLQDHTVHSHQNAHLTTPWNTQETTINQTPGTSAISKKTRYRENEELDLRQRLTSLESRYGLKHPASLDAMSRLANVLQDQGRLGSAEGYYKQVAKSYQATLGEDDIETISAFLDLGMILLSQSQVTSAEKLCRNLYSRASSILSNEHRLKLQILNELGTCRYNLGDIKEAEVLLRDSIDSGRRILMHDDDLLLRPMGTLAKVLVSRGELVEAEKLLLFILEAKRFSWKPVDIIHMHVRSFLGYVYGRKLMFQQSEATLKQVLAEQIRLLGPEHKETLVSQKYLAITIRACGRHDESDTILQDTLQKLEKSLGKRHSETLRCRGDLVKAMNGRSKFTEAENFARELSSLLQEGPAQDNDLMSFISFELGISYEGQGRLDEALVMFEKLLEESACSLGDNHLKTLHLGNNVTKLKQHMERRLVVQPSMDLCWT